MLEYFLSPAKLSGPFAHFADGRGGGRPSAPTPSWLQAWDQVMSLVVMVCCRHGLWPSLSNHTGSQYIILESFKFQLLETRGTEYMSVIVHRFDVNYKFRWGGHLHPGLWGMDAPDSWTFWQRIEKMNLIADRFSQSFSNNYRTEQC